jgi:hypothetical protein
MSRTKLPAVAKMVIGESRNFPDLARVWHDTIVFVALNVMTGLIAKAQAKGEVKPGDPRLYAFSLMGPMIMGAIFREVFGEFSQQPVDLEALAAQHARTVLKGMLVEGTER